jgi:N6-adenosine-specific RNA methylase IME4
VSGQPPTPIAAIPVALRQVADLRPHPQAGLVPALSGEEYIAFRADIGRRGIQVPLEVTAEGVVLDGHARLRAARELRLAEVPVRVIAPEDELEHILRAALLRRQLGAGQRAALAVRLLPIEELREQAQQRQLQNLRHGDEPADTEVATLPARGERTREFVAKLSGAGSRTVQDVITVHEHDPALFEQVVQAQLSANTAASKVRRALRDAGIPSPAPMPDGPFQLIYADPPWRIGSPDSEFAPEQHYPTMPLAEIKELQVPAADDCVLFLWVVSCLLPQGLEVLRAWGFDYRANMAWIKNGIGIGVWFRQRHELLLVGIKGQISPPEPEDRCDSVLDSRRRKHSQKPDEAYARIEQMYPELSKLELFARGAPRPGWQSWGNQAEPESDQKPADAELAEDKPTKPEGGHQ